MLYLAEPSQFLFREDKFIINFSRMTESVGGLEREIRRVEGAHFRQRMEGIKLSKGFSQDQGIVKSRNYD